MRDPIQRREDGRVWRTDYRPPAWLVERVELEVAISRRARVTSRLSLRRNPDAPREDLWLDGRDFDLLALRVDGRDVRADVVERSDAGLWIRGLPDACELGAVTELDPDANDSMQGLYRSGALLCTQCEPHGFSRITPFPDRPDVLARYRVRIEADRDRYPRLLSNGNLVGSGRLPGNRHWAEWDDPYPKPCYLFALVAGRLSAVRGRYRTASGRSVRLAFWVDPGNEARIGLARRALRQAMAFDERTWGLECDLDCYQVVAVRDFNAGAMENKGLNVFNARYALFDPRSCTDADAEQLRAVIAHEYFHNWTGNRVTCRDWFQLSLKEGLTVLREQLFMEATGMGAIERLRQVRLMRERQFAEDSGPLAHAVRPESYEEINNFYTLTVYEKGAELMRMLHTRLGPDGFRAGLTRFLRDNDGRAATLEDLFAAMQAASGEDLSGIAAWFERPGTPVLQVHTAERDGRCLLCIRRDDPGAADDPREILLRVRAHAAGSVADERLLRMTGAQGQWLLDAPADALVAVNLGFSSPVRIERSLPPEQWCALALCETDPVARWDAVRALFEGAFAEALQGSPGAWLANWVGTLERLASRRGEDPALLSELLRVPDALTLARSRPPIVPPIASAARELLCRQLAEALGGRIGALLEAPQTGMGRRALSRRALAAAAMPLALRASDGQLADRVRQMARPGMPGSLRIPALEALAEAGDTAAGKALEAWHAEFSGQDQLAIDRWFRILAAARDTGPAELSALLAHPDYDRRNPDRVRAVLATFARVNPAFHDEQGVGLRLLVEQIEALDARNPQLAARLTEPLADWRLFATPWRERMRDALGRLAGGERSADVHEIASRALAGEGTTS